jgi:hypothetical protein
VQRISEFRQTLVGPRRGGIDLGGTLHLKSFMGPFDIELADEGVKTGLAVEGC